MARRSTTAAGDADRKFPIRIKVRVPPTGLGTMIVGMDVWLKKKFGPTGYGQGPASATGMDATALHFMTIEDAQAFLLAFPRIELAVGVILPPPLTRVNTTNGLNEKSTAAQFRTTEHGFPG